MKELEGKLILDATCGGWQIWFQKALPEALYMDIRAEAPGCVPMRPNFCVAPDILADFRDMPFPDKSFKLVVWDPPHLKNLPQNSWFRTKYGSLEAETWQADLKKGFSECWRVLDDYGVLIFKWSSSAQGHGKRDISTADILKIIPQKPLFGHPSGSKLNTVWMCFMKFPEGKE